MNSIEKHFQSGQHAAMRGCWRVLCNAPSEESFDAWYRGYDSVPQELRRTAPLTGPIPQDLLDRLAELVVLV
jgi:hypothetical protein